MEYSRLRDRLQTDMVQISIDDHDSVRVLKCTGSLAELDAARLEKSLHQAIADHRYKIVLDFSGIEFISSVTLGILVVLKREIRDLQGDIRITAPDGAIKQIFETTMLDRVFELYDHTENALNAFATIPS